MKRDSPSRRVFASFEPAITASDENERLVFGPFEVDLRQRSLRRDGALVALGAKPFALLETLLLQAPHPVSRQAASDHLWPDVHVADNNLRVQLWALRRALGDDARNPSYVETLPGVGYRFVAPVLHRAADAEPPPRAAGADVPSRRSLVVGTAAGLAGLAVGGLGLSWLPHTGHPSPHLGYQNSAGYADYLKARMAWELRSRDGIERASMLYRRALRLDPTLAPAMAGLAEALLQVAITHAGPRAPRAAFAAARYWAQRAADLDAELAVPHSVLGHAAFLAERDLARAESAFRRSVALDGQQAQVWQRYGWFLLTRGHEGEARRAFGRALTVDRLGANANSSLGLLHYCLRNDRAAARQLEATRAIRPEFGLLWLELARVRDLRGDHGAAVDALETARSLLGDESEVLASLAYNLARGGRRGDARQLAGRLHRRVLATGRRDAGVNAYVSPYHLAIVALGLDETERARCHLLDSWRDRSLWLPWLRFDHRLEPLGPTRARLLKRLGLPPAVGAA
ncbi:MAG: winged helix-turn-helix domain-containing protein [Acidobacteriota bacterium]